MGFINATGEFEIPPQFDETSEFSDGLAKVKLNDKWGLINVTGGYEGTPQFDEIHKFSDGLARVKLQGKYCFINKKGDIVLRPNFDFCDDFSEGLARIAINPYNKVYFYEFPYAKCIKKNRSKGIEFWAGKYGFINTVGEIVINPQFDFVLPFNNDVSIFGVGEYDYKSKDGINIDGWHVHFGLINKNGKIIAKPDFDDIGYFKNGKAEFRREGNTLGLIDKSGEIIIKVDSCLHFSDFSDGLAAFSSSICDNTYNKVGYVDLTGKVVIKPRFVEAEPFKNGYARVKVENWFGKENGEQLIRLENL